MSGKLKGLDQVLKNLNREINKVEGRSAKGLKKAALLVRRESQQKTPVDTGNLRASAYTDSFKTTKGPAEEIGYTAEYAPWVHEAPGTLKTSPPTPRPKLKDSATDRGFFWDPQSKAEPQFLRKALVENELKIIKIIENNARIKT